MKLYLDERHERLRAEVREFAEAEIGPLAASLDEASSFPWDNVRKMADRGYFGVNVAEEYGGLGLDYLSYLLVIEEVSRVDASHGITISAHSTLGISPILNFGSDAQKRRYVPLLAGGKVLGGFGLTEPGSGSDSARSRTVAVRETAAGRSRGERSSTPTPAWGRSSW
jgi:butyryl-CoA dehydrogenase